MNILLRDDYTDFNGMTVRHFAFCNESMSCDGMISCHKGYITFQVQVGDLAVAIYFEAIDDDAVIDKATEVIGMLFDNYGVNMVNATVTHIDDHVMNCEINGKYEYTISVKEMDEIVVLFIAVKDEKYDINCCVATENFSDANLVQIPTLLSLGRDKCCT